MLSDQIKFFATSAYACRYICTYKETIVKENERDQPTRDQVQKFSFPETGLPEGIFLNRKSRFGSILEGLAMEEVGI
jgi:hypothetical protein